MNDIHFVGDIGFSTYTNAVYLGNTSIAKPLPDANLTLTTQYVPWGNTNLEPKFMADDIENSGVLNASIASKVRMAIGKGIEPFLQIGVNEDGTEVLQHVQDEEINDWFRNNNTYKYSYKSIYNLLAYGWGSTQFLLNKSAIAGDINNVKINRVFATDVYTARLGKKGKNNFIENLFLCSDWESVSDENNEKVIKIPVLKEEYEVQDLTEKSNTATEFAMLHRLTINGKQYYPDPLWKSAKEWVKISRSIPALKKAINKNQMLIKYVITINDTYWGKVPGWDTMTADDKKNYQIKKYNEIDKWLTGEQNAGKSLVSGSYYDPISKERIKDILIEVIEDKFKEGKMLPDNAAADKQILFAQFFNPAIWGGNLLGDGASGGAGSGSDIREAFLVLMMLMETERKMNLEVFDVVAKFNGWTKKLEKEMTITDKVTGEKKQIIPKLVFRYKSGLLTTLDTGKSTKSTAA